MRKDGERPPRPELTLPKWRRSLTGANLIHSNTWYCCCLSACQPVSLSGYMFIQPDACACKHPVDHSIRNSELQRRKCHTQKRVRSGAAEGVLCLCYSKPNFSPIFCLLLIIPCFVFCEFSLVSLLFRFLSARDSNYATPDEMRGKSCSKQAGQADVANARCCCCCCIAVLVVSEPGWMVNLPFSSRRSSKKKRQSKKQKKKRIQACMLHGSSTCCNLAALPTYIQNIIRIMQERESKEKGIQIMHYSASYMNVESKPATQRSQQ